MRKLILFARKYVWLLLILAIVLGIGIERLVLDKDEVQFTQRFEQRAAPALVSTPSSSMFEASANERVQPYANYGNQTASGSTRGYEQYRPQQQPGMHQSNHPRQNPQASYGSGGQQIQTAGVPTGFAPAMQNSNSGSAFSSGSSASTTNGFTTNGQMTNGLMTNGMDAQGLKAQHVAQFGNLDGLGRNQQMRQPWQGSVAGTSNSFNPGGGQYWGIPLQERPQHFLFGYGSLMNSESRGATSGKVSAAVPVRLSAEFGYIREWNFRSPTSKLTALGIRKRQPGEDGSTINGVIYPVEGGSIEKFDEREEGYTRVLVPRNMIEAVGWMSLPKEGQIWVYVPEGPSGEAGVGLPLPDAFYPVLQSYIDICVTGALEYGEDFAREFLETTFGWGPYWLNDRELPRRPWVHQKKYKTVDAILGKWPMDPRRNALHLRRLPTEYGLHFANQYSR